MPSGDHFFRCPVYPLPYIPGLGRSMQEIFKMLPYLVTIIVLILQASEKKKEYQPPESLWQLLLPRRSINEKSFTIPEYTNKLRNRLNRWRVSIINMFVIETRHLFSGWLFLLRLITSDKLYKPSDMGQQSMFLPVYDIKLRLVPDEPEEKIRTCRLAFRSWTDLAEGWRCQVR